MLAKAGGIAEVVNGYDTRGETQKCEEEGTDGDEPRETVSAISIATAREIGVNGTDDAEDGCDVGAHIEVAS
jgi:hypothetical protein